MELKLVKVPFEVELAKKIANGEVEGRIMTRDDKKARIVCWDAEGRDDYILALLSSENREYPVNFMPNGRMVKDERTQSDLMLEIPEYMTFKDGDIIKLSNDTYTWLSIIKDIDLTDDGKGGLLYFTHDYVSILINDGDGSVDIDTYSDAGRNVEKATEEEKQKLIDALKASKDPKAKEYLKRFFGVEQKQEYEFKPFDKVLVKDHDEDSGWRCSLFSHKNEDGLYICVGSIFEQCIPYEGNEHLLGTSDNPEHIY